MLFGELFAGIGGFGLGLERAGMRCAWQVEIDPFARAVLAKHWPNVRRFPDVHFVSKAQLEPVDLICGGFPCQDLSPAGAKAGLTGHRSGLWREFRRLIDEARPRFVIIENSGSSWRKWVPFVRRDLFGIGYASLPIRLRASDFGAPHERSRVFVVADTDGGVARAIIAAADARRIGARQPNAEARAVDINQPNARSRAREASTRGTPTSPDVDGVRELQPEGGESEQWRRPRDCPRWATEPDVARVVHGLPAGMDRRNRRSREAALGNAVCPPIVEWLGRQITRFESNDRSGEKTE